ncbi:MAG: hypothetical protein GY906_19750 [bacterium]|nr:hypothetical protein [bacterium]
MADGLPSNHVRDIAQTPDGYLWLATSAGVVRFDGMQPRVFNLLSTPPLHTEDINEVEVGPDESLWIGSLGGGGLIQYRDGQFTRHTVGGGSSRDILSLLSDSSGTLWIGTDSGLYFRQDDQAIMVPNTPEELASVHVTSLFQDHENILWIGTRGAGIFSYENGRFTSFTRQGSLSSNDVEAVLRDRQGTLWVGTQVGLDQVDAGNSTTHRWLTPDLAPSAAFWNLIEDRNGRIWAGSNAGLGRITEDSQQFLTTENQALPDQRIRSLFEDRDGNIWIGYYGGGLSRLSAGPIRTFGLPEGLAETRAISVIEDSTGTLWVATSRGAVHTIDPSGIETVTGILHDEQSAYLRSIAIDAEGAVWLGTDRGLQRIAGGILESFTVEKGLPSNRVRVVYADPMESGILWIGTIDKGLCRFHGGRCTNFDVSNGLSNNSVRWIIRSRKGALWIGTESGLNRLIDNQITTYTTADGLPSNTMRSGYEAEDGTPWIGTRAAGLVRYRDGAFTTFTTRDGLIDNSAWCVLEDQKHLWISSDRGIQRVLKSELDARSRGERDFVTVRLFGRSEGMRSSECNGGGYPTGWKTRDGRLWFPTMNGIVGVDPHSPLFDLDPPPVMIESIYADSKPVALTSGTVLPAGHHNLDISYAALAFATPETIRFAYRLDGHDNEWVNAGQRRVAHYANLSAGDYTFRATAINETQRSSEEATFRFSIKQHIYQSLWFIVPVVLASIALVVWVVILLVNHQKEKTVAAEVKLAQARQALVRRTRFTTIGHLAANIAHELKNPLGAARNSVFFLKRTIVSESPKAGEHLKNIDREIGTAVMIIDEILSMTRETAPEKCSLKLEEAASEAFSRIAAGNDALRLELDLEPREMCIFVDPAQFNQVLTNFLSNAVHAMDGAGCIELSGRSAVDADTILLSDSGPGIPEDLREQVFEALFTTKAKGSGLGLAISRAIIERHGGSISLEPPGRGGASFRIILPREQSGS